MERKREFKSRSPLDFARNVAARMRGATLSTVKGPRIAPHRGLLVALACALAVAGWSATRSARQSPLPQVSARPRAAAASAAKPAPGAPTWRYDAVVRRNLFMPPAPQQQKLAALPPVKPMPLDSFDQRKVSDVTPASVAATSLWTYAGYATVNGKPLAIVENSSTRRAEFLTVGQTLDGSVVTGISPQVMKLTRGHDTRELRLSEAFTATPLNEPPKATPQPAAAQGPRWGSYPGAPGGPGGAGGAQVNSSGGVRADGNGAGEAGADAAGSDGRPPEPPGFGPLPPEFGLEPPF